MVTFVLALKVSGGWVGVDVTVGVGLGLGLVRVAVGLGLGDFEALGDADGLLLALGDVETLGDTDALGDVDALGLLLALGEVETLGLLLALAELDALGDPLGGGDDEPRQSVVIGMHVCCRTAGAIAARPKALTIGVSDPSMATHTTRATLACFRALLRASSSRGMERTPS
jgi:hypothetical protein